MPYLRCLPYGNAAAPSEFTACGACLFVGFFTEVPDAQDGPLPMPRPPVVFRKTPSPSHHGGPALGQDTETVLAGIGLSAVQIQTLRERGIIGSAGPSPTAQERTQ